MSDTLENVSLTLNKMNRKQIGTLFEIEGSEFQDWRWADVSELLTKISQAFRYRDEDMEFKVIYKPETPSSPPTIGIKVTYQGEHPYTEGTIL